MSDVSVLGLGNMGGALARAILKGGYGVMVWNRSAPKIDAIAAMGAEPAGSLAKAVSSSPVVVICVTDYSTSRSLLISDDVSASLIGRTVIQLSTGSPEEAQEFGDLCNSLGATYVDGAILVLPRDVGSQNAQLLFSGSGAAFRSALPILNCLGGDIRFLGENVRAAATLDLAWLCQRLGMILGALHGALLCEAENVEVGEYGSMFDKDDRVHVLANTIQNDDYDKPNVSVEVWNSIANRILTHAHSTKINDAFPVFSTGLFNQAVDGGLANQDVAALIKVLREG